MDRHVETENDPVDRANNVVQPKGEVMKKVVLILLLPLLMLAQSGIASAEGDSEPASPAVENVPPAFDYKIGKTTFDEANSYWAQNNMKILGHGLLGRGTGSGIDGVGWVSMPNVELYDVENPGFHGVHVVRFGFYEGVLYQVQAQMKSLFKANNPQVPLTDEEIAGVEKQLLKEYGPPQRRARTMFGSMKKPDVSVWYLGKDRLVFTHNKMTTSLTLNNEAMNKKVAQYVKTVCKSYNTKDRIICW